jgi:glutamate formiminotransferase
VACNIYITASASHKSTLLRLLRSAQDRCGQLRTQNGCVGNLTSPVGVIHAYADIPYDRSSIHLAGRSDCVTNVASELILSAINVIDVGVGNRFGENADSRHPFVGLVDHVSVMPLAYPMNQNHSPVENCSNDREAATNAARDIGRKISKTKLVNVHYYGMACPQNTPLAKVRRESTSFFQSGGAIDREQNGQHRSIPESKSPLNLAKKGDATVGTPINFVENFNIRLTSKVNFDQAKTLTQFLRGRNIGEKGYGVAGVEALTLVYNRDKSQGGSVYEVACNLTKPKEGGGVQEVRAQLDKWIKIQSERSSVETDGEMYFVEDAYRVGTTEEQCRRVLLQGKVYGASSMSNNETFWEEHDKEVFCKFEEHLSR